MATTRRQLIDSIKKQARRELGPEYRRDVLALFEIIKREVINAFLNDPVSQELAGGPDGSSEYLIEGNLFTFLGIPAGRKPLAELEAFLEQKITITAPNILTPGLDLRTICSFPSEEDFAGHPPFQIQDGAWSVSWPVAIENGIPGLARFNPLTDKGRSTGGLQMKKDRSGVRGDWRGVSYISKYNNRFRRELGKGTF